MTDNELFKAIQFYCGLTEEQFNALSFIERDALYQEFKQYW